MQYEILSFEKAMMMLSRGNIIQYKRREDQSWVTIEPTKVPPFILEPQIQFREYIAPPRKKINGYAYPYPFDASLKDGTIYYVPSINITDKYIEVKWRGLERDLRNLENGFVYLTKSDAIECAEAIIRALHGVAPKTLRGVYRDN